MSKNLKTITVCPNDKITREEFYEDCKRRKAKFQEKIMQEYMIARDFDLQPAKSKKLA